MTSPKQRRVWTWTALVLAVLVLVIIANQPAQAQTFTVLHNFRGGSDGTNPYAGLIRDAAGNLYGTTDYGGSSDYGTVFKVDTSGKESVLYSFAGGSSDGRNPYAVLVRDAAGNLYGTTELYPTFDYGTVFKVDMSGKETVLHAFTGPPDGAYPIGGLIRDRNGNLYGTTNGGGDMNCNFPYGCGTVFKVDTSGKETVLYSFTGSPDGAYPAILTSLLVDKNDTLYGVTGGGGSAVCGCGTLYKLSKSGTETVLYSFTGGTTDGCSPYGTLATDTMGSLYGTTGACGSSNLGVVWKFTARGIETVLHSFIGGPTDGSDPDGVITDTSGNLYGETVYGGPSGVGTVYELSKKGKVTLLHRFAGPGGERPVGGLLRDASGNLYGTAYEGGSHGDGTVWKLTP